VLPAIALLVEAALVLVVVGIAVWGFLFWDRRYRGSRGAAPSFTATPEVFRDPTTGRMMRVFFNGATGERQYREEPQPGA
jgi:hypothetical protein